MDINLKYELELMLDNSSDKVKDSTEDSMKKFVWVSVRIIDYPEISFHCFKGEGLLDAIKNEIIDDDSDLEEQLSRVNSVEEYERSYECIIEEISPTTYLGVGIKLEDIIRDEWNL